MFGGGQTKVRAMSEPFSEFEARLRRVQALGVQSPDLGGASPRVDHNGYIVFSARRPRRSVPWSGIILLILSFFLVKGAMVARMGLEFYDAKIAQANSETVLENIVAWTMSPDPVSEAVTRTILSLR